jgi:serine protease SohB
MELATSVMLCISAGSYMCATCVTGCCCYKLCNKTSEKKQDNDIIKIVKYSNQKEKDNKLLETIFDNKEIVKTEPSDKKTNKYIYYKFDNYSNKKELKDFLTFNDCDEFVGLEKLVQMLYNQNDNNYTLILHISSPGGSAMEFEKLYDKLMDLRKKNIKIIGIIDDVCASGGYMLACACNEIYATTNSSIGSIGVYTTHFNAKGLGDKIGIEEFKFKTSNAKGGLSIFGNVTDDEKKNVDEIINYTFDNFKNIVKTSRTNIDLDKVSTAKVWYSNDALELNLIDKIVSFNEYINSLNEDGDVYYVSLNKKKEKKNFVLDLLNSNYNDITNIFDKSFRYMETKLKMF